jgi:hypothetical protein
MSLPSTKPDISSLTFVQERHATVVAASFCGKRWCDDLFGNRNCLDADGVTADGWGLTSDGWGIISRDLQEFGSVATGTSGSVPVFWSQHSRPIISREPQRLTGSH